MSRENYIAWLRGRTEPWDLVIIGGGATGVGTALDAASRGLDVVLLEQSDFGKGTSSRSTKLVHGGVRYLQQGNITLVRDALRERSLLRNNAPHLVHDMPFLIPCRNLWQRFFYGVGLKVYDLLATRKSFGKSHGVSGGQAVRQVPTIRRELLSSGVIYHDGQFDDARLLINMAQTAHEQGATLLNYFAVTGLTKNAKGKISGVVAEDRETSEAFEIAARCVVNAAGPFCDAVRRLDDQDCERMVAASQGVHIVLPRSFFPGDTALIVPKTSDGRVLFMIPWHDHTLVGTTDTSIPTATLEPTAQEDEIQFLLDTTAEYLNQAPTRADVLSVFVGIRPLVKGDKSARTASLSRDHVIRASDSGLLTITGGKWTTVRKMSEDCVDRVIEATGLTAQPCPTKELHLHGYLQRPEDSPRGYYGSDLAELQLLESETPELSVPLHEGLTLHGSDVVWAVRQESARTVEDVLARRARSLFLNAPAAVEVAPKVAELMAAELGQDAAWCEDQVSQFNATAKHYLIDHS
ncbi:glycerol-3-phosphate dehydrogenase/oxidase [Roseimaritima ulvae]|uniref:Glycerol-3-phosphate dehydrogenase n=1 Tax=Roseimaritima ulvae TaxID=980254 RepID=A0A5B9QL64_9BACT|nr:glycerol-3-phosphate dehydrogenase/oxidase [Roseimaritima ulvae]QEG38255.1 Aerobic glycerol-3-phosphate dehydrogenase [Roseimaritima ulvae]